jgi:hypothetical protein
LIFSGIYGYPKDEALRVATAAIRDFISEHDIDVSLVVFDKAAFVVSEKLLGEIANYIDEHYIDEHAVQRRRLLAVERETLEEKTMMAESIAAAPLGLDDIIGNLDEPFSATLLRLIDASIVSNAKHAITKYTIRHVQILLFFARNVWAGK